MIIVTGAAGFIGSNIVKELNRRGVEDILAIDDLGDGRKFLNLADCAIADYLDKDDFRRRVREGQDLGNVSAVIHQGACSTTTEWDGRFMMDNNYEYTKDLLAFCQKAKAPFIYASSAATYGTKTLFREERQAEGPVNVYAWSKWLFDEYVRRRQDDLGAQVVGLRYFNVYGPREQHKGTMASVAFHFNNQLMEGDELRLFEGSDGYGDGEQRRDFLYVGDAVKVTLWFLDNPHVSGIFNTGTGRSQTFNDVANAVIAWHGRGTIRYIPFPDHLKGAYQSFTEANLEKLRAAGYDGTFKTVEEGVRAYLDEINKAKR